jgi:hypothetical protein
MRHAILVVVLIAVIAAVCLAQTPSPADGPWSGQVQCVLSVRGPDYTDDQTHTWRLTGEPPKTVGMFRQWPAIWSVQGNGRRQLSTPPISPRKELPGSPSESWKTTVPETSAPISVWEPSKGRIRFGSQHGLLNINGGITGVASTGAAINAPFQEWEFPVVEDDATLTTISGTRTRSVPGRAWRQPTGVLTTETCTWNYTKGGSAARISSATGTTSSAPTLRAAGPVGTIQPAPTRDQVAPKGALADAIANGAAATNPVTVGGSLSVAVPHPPTPVDMKAIVSGNAISVMWSFTGTYAAAWSFSMTRNGIASQPARWRRDYFQDVVPVPGDYTYRIVGHDDVVGFPNDGPAATVTVHVPPWPGWKQKYRVILNAVRVNQQTSDNILNQDGQGDEIYLGTQVDVWVGPRDLCEESIRAGRVCSSTGSDIPPAIVDRKRLQTPLYGDTFNRPASEPTRIRAGSLSAAGGIKSGDLIPTLQRPYDPASNFGPPTMTALPQLLWEGDLEAGKGKANFLLVTPSVWEWDGNRKLFDDWMSKFVDLHDAAKKARAEDSLQPFVSVLGAAVQSSPGFDVPVGNDAGPELSGFWNPRSVLVTQEAIEKALAARNPVTAIDYVDHSSLGGNYTAFLRFERVSSPPPPVPAFNPQCGGNQALQADGNCR